MLTKSKRSRICNWLTTLQRNLFLVSSMLMILIPQPLLAQGGSIVQSPGNETLPLNAPASALATSVCLAAVQDAYIIQDAPTQNKGGDNDLRVKADAGKERRLLIQFNLSSIPVGSTVVSSTLRLYEDTKKDGQTITLYRLTGSWVEAQVTWNSRATGTAWTAAGGDINTTPLASFLPNVDNQYRDIDLLGVTQGWVSGSYGNYGVLLRSTGVNGEVTFRSREESNVSKNPQLCITYQQGGAVTPTPTITPTPTSQPTTSVCLPAVQDAYIIQDAPTQNHDTENDLRVKADAGKERRILIRFDLSSIPSSSIVVSSTLRLYENTTKDGQTITLYRLTNSWVETQVTWNSRATGTAWTAAGGDFNTTALATFLPNLDNQYRDIDVSGVTEGWVSGSYSNYGVLLRSTGVNGEVTFKSREESNVSKNPQLCVTYQTYRPLPPYTPMPISPPDGASGVPTSPALSVSVSDPNNDNLTVKFYGRTSADFTLVALPDTGKYASSGSSIFDAQTQWVVDHRSDLDIAFVTHHGDVVDDWNVPSQWDVANSALSRLEQAGIPYGIGIGNCDEDYYGNGGPVGTPPTFPNTTWFNTYFPVSRFAGRPYYGGAYSGDNANSYQLFSAGGMDFIVINLEYLFVPSNYLNQTQAILGWADNLLKTHNNRRGIVVTHFLLDPAAGNNFSSYGSMIFAELKDNPNLFLMLSGHLPPEGRRQDLGTDGHTIYSLRADYETRANGGDGWLRLLRFSPSTNKIYVSTYSPSLNQYETDADSQFELDYAMSGPSFQLIGTANVPSGSVASVVWPGLLSNEQYEWYATVSDATSTTIGSTSKFSTGSAPVITTQPVDQTVIVGQTASFTAGASGNPTPSVQWQVSTNGTLWNDIPGATSTTYSFTAQLADTGKQFHAVFINPLGSTISNAATLSVTDIPPNPPTLISPADGASGVSTSPTLSVSVSHPLSRNLTVEFYGRSSPDFTLAVLPETQKYTSNSTGLFDIQTQWIADHRFEKDIAFVTHLGGIVDDWNVPDQWTVANAALSRLEPAGIPFGLGVGNTDEDNYGVPPNTTWFNSYFPESRFAGRPYYGGAYNGDNANSYQLFSAGGMDFIIIHLKYNVSYDPAQGQVILGWADALLKSNSDRRAIVVTHYLLNTDNSFSADGNLIFTELKDNPNLFLMLGAHMFGEGQRQDLGTDGHTIYSLRTAYYNRANGGDGWLRLLRFSPSTNKIYVSTYSPSLNQYETDADSQFALDYAMSGPNFQLIGTKNVPSGSVASVVWSNLLSGEQYEWYAAVSDGITATTGPIWKFSTGSAP